MPTVDDFTVTTSFSLPMSLRAWIESRAIEERRSRSSILVEGISLAKKIWEEEQEAIEDAPDLSDEISP